MTPDEERAAIDAAFPVKTGRHDLWYEAMRLVGGRHAKGDLVELVNWLLFTNAESERARTEAEADRAAMFLRMGIEIAMYQESLSVVDEAARERIAAEARAETAERNYVTLCDAVCRESAGVEDACRQVRETRERVAELEAAVRKLLASAYPHPTDEQPTMTAAWAAARAVLGAPKGGA